jgi:hypothetical protein
LASNGKREDLISDAKEEKKFEGKVCFSSHAKVSRYLVASNVRERTNISKPCIEVVPSTGYQSPSGSSRLLIAQNNEIAGQQLEMPGLLVATSILASVKPKRMRQENVLGNLLSTEVRSSVLGKDWVHA